MELELEELFPKAISDSSWNQFALRNILQLESFSQSKMSCIMELSKSQFSPSELVSYCQQSMDLTLIENYVGERLSLGTRILRRTLL